MSDSKAPTYLQSSLEAPPAKSLGDVGGRSLALRIIALLVITGGSIWLALNPEWVQGFGSWGYLSIFLISFFTSATVILPAPGLALVFAMGAALDPIALGVVAGFGSGLGELSGYIAGATGRGLLERSSFYQGMLKRFTVRHTVPALFLLALIPLPLFDFAGVLAGAIRMRISVFLSVVIAGKIGKHILVALVGAGSLPMLRGFFGF